MTKVGEFDIHCDGVDIEVTEDDLPELSQIRGAVDRVSVMNPKETNNDEIRAKENEDANLPVEVPTQLDEEDKVEDEHSKKKKMKRWEKWAPSYRQLLSDQILDHRFTSDGVRFQMPFKDITFHFWVEGEWVLEERKDVALNYMKGLIGKKNKRLSNLMRRHAAFSKIFFGHFIGEQSATTSNPTE